MRKKNVNEKSQNDVAQSGIKETLCVVDGTKRNEKITLRRGEKIMECVFALEKVHRAEYCQFFRFNPLFIQFSFHYNHHHHIFLSFPSLPLRYIFGD